MITLPIANGLYNDRTLPNSHQLCKNWYVSIVETQGLSQRVLYGTPGLTQRATAGGTSKANRGSHTKENIPYFIQGNSLHSLNQITLSSGVSYELPDLGPILGTGRVSMADNGEQLMIVSEGNGYIYNENVTFTVQSTPITPNGVGFGDDQFVAVGDGTDVMTSPDGVTWTQRTASDSSTWNRVAYGQNTTLGVDTWVAVASSAATTYCMTSADGITWANQTLTANDWQDLIYDGQNFVAVFGSGVSTTKVATSQDGTSWTARTTPDDSWRSISEGYVGVAASGGIMTAISSAGPWVSAGSLPDANLQNVTRGNGLHVASGYRISDTSQGVLFTSDDVGVTWTEISVPDGQWTEGVYENSTFILTNAAYDGSSNSPITLTSYDGITWTPRYYVSLADDTNGIACGNGICVITSSDNFAGADTEVVTSISGGAPLVYINEYDPDFLANGTPQKVRFVDGYFAVTTDAKRWIRSAPNNGLDWNAADFGSAEADPDDIQAIEIDNNDVYLPGTVTIETFDNIGGAGFGFQRSGVVFTKGTIAPDSVLKTTDGIVFLGGGIDESPAFWVLGGNNLTKISHPGIDNALNQMSQSDLESCYCIYYSEAGGFHACFTFPSVTYCYDFASKVWHERESIYFENDEEIRIPWRVSSVTSAYGKLWAGDAIDGRIGEMSIDIYSEYGNFIEAQVSSPNFSNQGERAFWPKIEATMEAGVGNSDTPDPVLTYDYSDDGKIFKNARERKVGMKGQYNKRTIWRRNGSAPRYRTNRFTYTGKTKRSFIKLEGDPET